MPVHCETPDTAPHVALVTLDRPEKANALNPVMLRELAATWRALAEDESVRCVVVTGAGDRVFCSGMDLQETLPAAAKLVRGETLSPELFEGLRAVNTALLADFDLGKPLVAAINGHARAGGLDMLLQSEIRYSVAEATFALEEVALGLYPTGNATVWLPRQLPWVHANELLLGGRPISAERAAQIGLINDVVSREELLPRALEMAAAIAENGPLAVRETRRGVRELLDLSTADAYVRQDALGRPLRASEDANEGRKAFFEKRKPVFRGR